MRHLGQKTRTGLAVVVMAACVGLTLSASAQSARPSGYLTADQWPDSLTVIGPPPASGSAAEAADKAAFEASRALEGSPRWAQAQADVDLFGPAAQKSFACAIGKRITLESTPVLTKLLDRIVIDAGGSTYAAKGKYNRARPMIDNDKPICVPREDWMKTNGSYPSGHAAAGWARGLILAELVPEKATAVTLRGREFGDSRWICGVHYPSDVEAGRTMGAAAVARLHADPAFMADLATAAAPMVRPASTSLG